MTASGNRLGGWENREWKENRCTLTEIKWNPVDFKDRGCLGGEQDKAPWE
jgi:hypothetical protein